MSKARANDWSAGVSPAGRQDAGAPKHRYWYNRGYLPHCDVPELIQMITFRLADSLPEEVVARWQEELRDETGMVDREEMRQAVEKYLDQGYGACFLKNPGVATLVENALHHFDEQRYRLLAWVVMPNHVHTIIETFPNHPLADVLHSWKSYTAKEANKLLHRQGEFWERDYFDRYMRDDAHLAASIAYIHDNPVKAGLVKMAEDWPYSSGSLHGAPASWRQAGETPALHHEALAPQ